MSNNYPNRSQNQNPRSSTPSATQVTITTQEEVIGVPTAVMVPPANGPIEPLPAVIEVKTITPLEGMVKIKPRESLNRARIGNEWYQFVKGKEVLVPKSVASWLEEKGIL